MSETKPAGCEAGMENQETDPDMKMACAIFFNERGELSPLRCSIFCSKVVLWFCSLLAVSALALITLMVLYLRQLYS